MQSSSCPSPHFNSYRLTTNSSFPSTKMHLLISHPPRGRRGNSPANKKRSCCLFAFKVELHFSSQHLPPSKLDHPRDQVSTRRPCAPLCAGSVGLFLKINAIQGGGGGRERERSQLAEGLMGTASFPSFLPSSLGLSEAYQRPTTPTSKQPPRRRAGERSSRGGHGTRVAKLASHLRRLLGGETLRSASSFRRHLLLLPLLQRPKGGPASVFPVEIPEHSAPPLDSSPTPARVCGLGIEEGRKEQSALAVVASAFCV